MNLQEISITRKTLNSNPTTTWTWLMSMSFCVILLPPPYHFIPLCGWKGTSCNRGVHTANSNLLRVPSSLSSLHYGEWMKYVHNIFPNTTADSLFLFISFFDGLISIKKRPALPSNQPPPHSHSDLPLQPEDIHSSWEIIWFFQRTEPQWMKLVLQ